MDFLFCMVKLCLPKHLQIQLKENLSLCNDFWNILHADPKATVEKGFYNWASAWIQCMMI